MKIRTLDIDELNERLAELEALRDAVKSERENLKAATDEDRDEIQGFLDAAEANFPEDGDEERELKALEELKNEIGERCGKISDEGGPFIHENDFEDYARELAEEIGAVDPNAGWPHDCIDWSKAADELRADYSAIEWGGETYLRRD